MKKYLLSLTVFLFFGFLTGCGQGGPLYLSNTKHQTKNHSYSDQNPNQDPSKGLMTTTNNQ